MEHMKRILSLLLVFLIACAALPAAGAEEGAYELVRTGESEALGGTVYYYRHRATGAEVVYCDSGAERMQFAIGFDTPPVDSKGANHVLEHALFCGSEKYPTKNIMYYLRNGSASFIYNGTTTDDFTYYYIITEHETEYFNMMDVFLNGIFHPLFLTDENIFRQQGIRVEYVDGEARYNGVVYNELRLKNLNTEENSVNFLADKLYKTIYGETAPAFNAGGELDAIKELTYEDLLRVYNTYYIPSNSMTYLAGDIDLDKTLDILDGFFSENTTAAPEIRFEDSKRTPEAPVLRYNIDEDTRTVDIGFMSSGVPASADAAERYARDILFEIIAKRMEAETGCGDAFTSGGIAGGISNLALLLSEIPIDRVDEVLAAYDRVVRELGEDGIDEEDIDTYLEEQRAYFFVSWENVFSGLLYHDDPLIYTEIDTICDFLKGNQEYFAGVLEKYFLENPCRVAVVSGNGIFSSEDSRADVSPEELEAIRRETEAFQAWSDAEDPQEVIDRIPFLTLDEIGDAPARVEPVLETRDGIPFYFTEKDGDDAHLFFPLDIADADLDCAQMAHDFLQNQMDAAGFDFYTALLPMENAATGEIDPRFLLSVSGKDLENLMDFLRSDAAWDADALAEYIRTAPDQILSRYYDPYSLSYELMNSAQSPGRRFAFQTSGTIDNGSPHYLHYLRELDPSESTEIAAKLRALVEAILDGKPTVEYVGSREGYEAFRDAACALFADAKERTSARFSLDEGCYSAATITKLADANHFMLAGTYGSDKYSGKLAVLGKVLTAKYIVPTMRGKYGAYGARVNFDRTGMVASVAGLADIDLAIDVWRGMGDSLRNMRLTQRELDAFIVSTVEDFDEWEYTASEYGAEFALEGRSPDESERIRREMLAYSVEDIVGYADFVDGLVNQLRVFAVLGRAAADGAEFEFAHYADAETLEITPAG